MTMVNGSMLNSALLGKMQSSIPRVIPSSMKWPTIKSGIPTDRSRYKLDAMQSNYRSDGNKIIRFELPNVFFGDFSRSCLDINVRLIRTGGTYARLSQGASCLFERMLISTGIEIEDVRSYNLLASCLTQAMVESDVHEVVGTALYGWGTQTERNTWGSGVKQYLLMIYSTFLNTGLIPLGYIRDKVAIEFYIADPSSIIETDSVNPVIIEILDAELHYDRIIPDDSYTKTVEATLSSGGLQLGGKIFEHYYNAINSNRATILINHRSDSLSSLVTLLRDDASVNDPLTNDKLINYFKYQMTQNQVKINSAFYPQEPIDTTGDAVEAYLAFLNFMGKWSIHGTFKSPPMITGAMFNDDKFIIINDLEQHPSDPSLINPIGTKQSSSTLFIDTQFAVAPPRTIRADTFVLYYVMYTVTQEGRITRYF